MLKACSLVLCLILTLAAPATVFAGASARVLSVTPGVRYSLGNAGEALAVKMDVPIKAVVVSDATGKAQLIFPDDSTLSIAPDTRISLAEYVDAEQEENIVLDLVSGTARIITGESNRKNPQAFTVNTPQASIGIRGTLVTIQAGGGVTRVYLTETSGKGVSVRNLHTGQVMELRKPGTIINVGAGFMEERKAQSEEAAAFSAALRGKSRAEIERATARAQSDLQRGARASLAPEGSLPPAGAADPVQLAALTMADRLDHANLVAMVPAVKPATPEVPNMPNPILPEPPVSDFVLTDISMWADATFTGTAICDYYNKRDTLLDPASFQENPYGQINNFAFKFASTVNPSEDSVFTETLDYGRYPSFTTSGSSPDLKHSYTYAPMEGKRGIIKINTDGSFVVSYYEKYYAMETSMTAQGKFTSNSGGIVNELIAYPMAVDKWTKVVAKEPFSIEREP